MPALPDKLTTEIIMADIVCPGNLLGRINDFRAGPGTYVRGTNIYASVVGPKQEHAAEDDGKPYLVVSSAYWRGMCFFRPPIALETLYTISL